MVYSISLPHYGPPVYDQAIEEMPLVSKQPVSKCCSECGNVCSGDVKECSSCGAVVGEICFASSTEQPPSIANQPSVVIIQPSTDVYRPQVACIRTENYSVRINDRLIYDFEKVMCCLGQHSGLQPQVKDQIPFELSEAGISTMQWYEWMSQLDEIQMDAPTLWGCFLMYCFPGFFIQSIICEVCCPISRNHCLSCLPCCYGDWYEALRNWMNKVNETLMEHGMHAKFLTYKPFSNAPKSKLYEQRIDGKDHNYEMSFLVIALNPDESKKLEEESWDHGVNDGCTSGIGRSV